MTFDEYQKLASRTSGNHENVVLISALGLAGEAGEVCDYLKKVYGHGHELDITKLKKELGDCFWYLADLCTRFHLKMNEVAELNIEKLQKRYPEGFQECRSRNREEGDV